MVQVHRKKPSLQEARNQEMEDIFTSVIMWMNKQTDDHGYK